MTVRGHKWLTGLIGFVELTIFVVAIRQVVRNAGNVWNMLGYASGFAAGTMVGMTIEERLALGFTVVCIISSGLGAELGEAARRAGFGVTQITGRGRREAVVILEVVVRRADLPDVLQIVNQVDNKALVTVEETRRVYWGWRLGK